MLGLNNAPLIFYFRVAFFYLDIFYFNLGQSLYAPPLALEPAKYFENKIKAKTNKTDAHLRNLKFNIIFPLKIIICFDYNTQTKGLGQ